MFDLAVTVPEVPIGLYTIGATLGLYWDNGKENGNTI